MLICLIGRAWAARDAEAWAHELLEFVPRVAVGERGVLWGDGRGLDAAGLAERIVARLLERGAEDVGCGVATTPVAARAAAMDRTGEVSVQVVAVGEDRQFLADRPLAVLEPEERLRLLLEGVGIETCGALAEVSAEAVEVRFGAGAVGIWRLARAEDERRLFRSPVGDRPQTSLDFVDYVVTDGEQLAFTANTLLGSILRSAGAARRARAAHGAHAAAGEW